jgi:threonine/homoserine/homoserine lactone efflux protein
MTYELILAFISYAFVTSITPGPNNVMLLASGANYGMLRSTPHILGVNLGFSAMVLAVGIGAGSIFTAVPQLQTILRVAGVLYLLYLAWQIARSAPMNSESAVGVPMTFLGAAAFQWVNPKAWVMVMGAVTTYLPSGSSWQSVALLAMLFGIVNLPCIVAWAGFGVGLRYLLTKPAYVRAFNYVMASILCFSLYPTIQELVSHWRS